MTEIITAPQSFEATESLAFVLPETIANGAILREPDYEVTPGTERLLHSLADDSIHIRRESFGSSSLMRTITSSEADADDVAWLQELLHNPDTTALRQQSTARLLSDGYDISEAMRIFAPAKKLIDAKFELGLTLTPQEENAVVRFGLFSQVLSVVEHELERPFRKTEVADMADFKTAPVPVVPEYGFLDPAIEAIGESVYLHTDTCPENDDLTDEIVRLAKLQGPKTAESMRQAGMFVVGAVDEIAMHHIMTTDGILSIEAIARRAEGGMIGRLSARAAGHKDRVESWNGSQAAYDTPWVSVVSGGGVSQA